MNEHVSLTVRDGIAIITVDNPPVNAIAHAVREGLRLCIDRVGADDGVAAAVIFCAGRTFMAGADIREFGRPLAPPGLPEIVDALEQLDKPVVAAVHGTALGGGCEVTLGCDYRVAVDSAKFGLPEVLLGLLPGAGGTQRLPRLIGAEEALNMMISGQPVNAGKALKLGLVDEIVDGDLLNGAVAFAQRLVREGRGTRRVNELVAPLVAPNFFAEFAQSIAKKTRGYFAPERIIQCVKNATELAFDQGVKAEQSLFAECMQSSESAGLRHMFFAEREVAKLPGITKEVERRPIEKVAVLGAGTMGGGIAMNFANVGIPVRLLEVEAPALERGLHIIAKNYENTHKKGRLSEADKQKRIGLIQGTLDYADLADADLIIEAVFENMAVKKEVFAKLDEVCKPGAILASNTSTLDVDEIASATSRPEDVLGLHFFSPANVMRLLEVVKGAKTTPEVLATCMDMAKTIHKIGVRLRRVLWLHW